MASDILTWEEYKILLSQLEINKKYKLLTYSILAGMTGLKISEIINLSWAQVISENSGLEKLQLNENLRKMILRVYETLGSPNREEKVFMNRFNSKIITGQYMNKELKRLAAKYGLSIHNFSTHSFRKMFGLRILEENGFTKESLEYLRKFYGHANVNMTKEYLDIKDTPKTNVKTSISF